MHCWILQKVVIIIGVGICLSLTIRGQDCSFHLCTAERLHCRTNRLARDARGCQLCKCEELPSRNRSCLLHGCTPRMLKCSGGLKTYAGCTLCQCEEQVNTTASTNTTLTTSCLPVSCPDLTCERHKNNPETGCPICECEEDTMSDFCPNPKDVLLREEMRRGTNSLLASSEVPKYKLSLGKLKKGFTPNQEYRVILKALDNSNPFKEYLLETGISPFMKIRLRSKRGKKTKIVSRSLPTASNHDINWARDCGTGHWKATSPESEGRLFPSCPTAVLESNSKVNKTIVTMEWVAPRCGCAYIRASLVDFTGSNAFMFEEIATTFNSTVSSSGLRTTLPLYRTVCARTSHVSRRKKGNNKKKPRRDNVHDWIMQKCCQVAKAKSKGKKCEKKANVYANSFARYRVMKPPCKTAFKKCCRQTRARNPDPVPSAAGNGTMTTGRNSHRHENFNNPHSSRQLTPDFRGDRPRRKNKESGIRRRPQSGRRYRSERRALRTRNGNKRRS